MICKGLHIFRRLLYSFLLIGILLVFLPTVFKIYPNVVLSGSMEPEIPVGSLAYISARYPVEKIQEQDIIVYELQNGSCILHRVIDVDEGEDTFQTKGDANDTKDLGKINFEQYRGKFLLSIPFLGYAVKFIGNKTVALGVLSICAALLWNDMAGERQKLCRQYGEE